MMSKAMTITNRLVALALLAGGSSIGCGTLRSAANASAFNDAESVCRPNLSLCVDHCRNEDRTSCDVLDVLIAEGDPAFAQFRENRGDPALSLAQLRRLHEDMKRICSDGVSRACPLAEVVLGRIDAKEKAPSEKAPEVPTEQQATPTKVAVKEPVPVEGNTVSPSTAATPAAVCDPLEFVSPNEAYVEQPRPYGRVSDSADLDGDGHLEVEVHYPTSETSVGLTLLKRTNDAACFATIYRGPGTVVTPRKSKSNGWLDVELSFGILTNSGRGYGTVTMKFDGAKYRWGKTVGCESWPDTGAKVDGCEEIVREEDPDRPSPGAR